MNTEQILEFHEIKRKLIEFAHTEHAKQKIQELTPYLSQAKAEAALRDTTEGMGIAVAILEELRRSQALFLVTTHYPEVKQYAEQTEGILNARMSFDKESLKPLYQLVLGEAGESCAFHIAQRLGMPKRLLERAQRVAYHQELLGEKQEACQQDSSGKMADKKNYVKKKPSPVGENLTSKFKRGDSVMVYPEDYDFSIIFDTVENRKIRHDMERKYVEGKEIITY